MTLTEQRWITWFLIAIFLTYSWCLYHLAYAYGGHVESLQGNGRMMVANDRLWNCQNVITRNSP